MKLGGTRKWLAAAMVAAAVSAPSSGWADARTEAKRHFEAGMSHIRAGRYDQGIAELERAYTIKPHPVVLYNVARAYADAGQLEKAAQKYREYLETDPEDAAEVLKIVTQLDRRIAEQNAARAKPDEPEVKPDEPKPRSDRAKPDRAKPDKPTPKKGDPSKEKKGDIYEERVVTASRRAQSPLDAPSSTTVITHQDIRLSGITRVPELLRRVPGMDVMQITGGDTNVSVRGLQSRLSNKLLVLVDGRVVKNDILGSTFWEAIPIDVDQIEQIEVVRGPGSSLYGADAFAGVVNIITIEPGERGTGMRLGFGDRLQGYGSAWTSHREGDFAYRASAGYTRYPRWTREVGPGRVDLRRPDIDPDIGAEQARFDLRTSYRLAKDQELELGGGIARGTINIYGVGPFNDYIVQATAADAGGAFKSKYLTIRSNYALLNATASAGHAYFGHSLYETDPVQHSAETDVELSHTFSFPSALTHSLIGGVNYRLKNIYWNYLVDEPPIEHHVGGFLQDAISFGGRFTLVGSGRVDYVPAFAGVVPSARGTFIARLGQSKRRALKASVATAFRTPTFLESYLDLPVQLTLGGLELQSSSRRDDAPDFRIGPEKILAAEVGYLDQVSDNFQFEIAGYYHRISDIIQLAPPRVASLSDLAGGLGTAVNPESGRYRVGSGGWENQCLVDHVFGGEVGGHFYGVEGLDVFANYAINYGIHQRPSGCLTLGDERTSHHKVNVGTQVRTPFGLNGEVTFHYQTKQLWGEQVATLTGIETQLFPLDGYHLLNGRLGYAFLAGDKAEISLVVFNALSGLLGPAPQMHPFGNRVGRRIMGFFAYRL